MEENISAKIEQIRKYQGFIGLSCAVVKGDKIIFNESFGKATIGGNIVDSDKTHFLIASISKIVTGMAAMKLQEMGKLSIDEDINKYLKVKVYHKYFSNVPITARHLLQHCSGLNDDESGLKRWRSDGDYPVPLEEHIANNYNDHVTWKNTAPGDSSYHYSNAGMTLLGYLIEQASGMNFCDFVAQEIFKPLEIKTAAWMISQMKDCEVAMPYQRNKEWGNYCVAEYPSCQLRITATDLCKILRVFTGDNNPVLSKQSVKLMCPDNFKNGLAWWGADAQYGYKTGDVWIHGGYMDGVRTQINYYPKHNAGFIILTNGEGSYSQIEDLLKESFII